MTLSEYAIRLGVAFALGSIIGIERQWRERMAGLRTNSLVSIGSASFVLISMLTVNENSPTRIAAQIVTGIGFLGAGVIMRDGMNIKGINTAATLWCSAAVGTLAGSGFLKEALLSTVVIFGANIILRPIAHQMNKRPINFSELESTYRFTIVCKSREEKDVKFSFLQAVSQEGLRINTLKIKKLKISNEIEMKFDIPTISIKSEVAERIAGLISNNESITDIEWKIIIGGSE
jgi:putative Mg2+ transporter-C (MgtC) family protein